jgi:hypothetical protein
MSISVASKPDGLHFAVKVVPGASRNRVIGALGGALKLAVGKPAERGAANAAVAALLAEALGVPRSAVRIVRGLTNPRKEIAVSGITVEELARRLGELCEGK